MVFLKDLPADTSVGYGGTVTTTRPTRIAILPIGYNDGYVIPSANPARVLLRGQSAPVLGQVSMDYTTVDVTDIPQTQVGDEAILIGRQGEESIRAEELADFLGGPPYRDALRDFLSN